MHICCLLFTGSVALGYADFGPGTGPIYMTSVNCNGAESSLLDCVADTFAQCTHSQDAGVICSGKLKVL